MKFFEISLIFLKIRPFSVIFVTLLIFPHTLKFPKNRLPTFLWSDRRVRSTFHHSFLTLSIGFPHHFPLSRYFSVTSSKLSPPTHPRTLHIVENPEASRCAARMRCTLGSLRSPPLRGQLLRQDGNANFKNNKNKHPTTTPKQLRHEQYVRGHGL